jgi:cytochrome c5
MKKLAKLFLSMAILTGSTAVFADGEALYKQMCFTCHDAGIAGAPKLGDKELWKDRVGKGEDALVATAIAGKNAMPPRGGTQFTDEQIKEVVTFMLSKLQ